MRPSDAPAASACSRRLWSSLGVLYPRVERAFCASRLSRREAGHRSFATRWRVGVDLRDPVARSLPRRTCKGLPRYRVILFDRAAVDHPAGFPCHSPSRVKECCFQVGIRPEQPGFRDFGAASCGPPRSPDYASTGSSPERRLQVWLPACWLDFDWMGLAPTGQLIRVSVYIQTSPLNGIAWSLHPSPSPLILTLTLHDRAARPGLQHRHYHQKNRGLESSGLSKNP